MARASFGPAHGGDRFRGERLTGVDRHVGKANACPRDTWLNNIVSVIKLRTGDGGVIHRVFAVK